MDVVTYALAQKYVKNAIGSLDTVTDVTVDGNSVVNADGVAEIVTPQILGEVADVKVNGSSVVDSEGVAQITLHDTTLANNFADEYDASTSYEVGNLCIKDLVLYKCTTATTGAWDDTKWEEVTVDDVLDEAGKVDDVQTYGGNTLVTNKIADLSALTIKKSIPSTPTAIATFSDGAEMVMPSLTVGIEAVQEGSGDPSPTNIRPIHGWDEVNVSVSGTNIWDEEWEVGGLNPLNGETTSENDRIRSKNYRPCKPNMTMFYYIPSGKGNLQIVFYDINKNYLGYYNFTTVHTFTTPNGCFFFKFNTGGSYGTTYNNDISINYPSTDTSYHAYNGSTLSVPFHDNSDNPITVYGGRLNVTSGELTVTMASVDLGTLNWSYSSFGVGSSWRTPVLTNMKSYADGGMPDILCEKYKPNTINKIYQDDVGIGIRQNGSIIYVNNQDSVNSPTGQLVYELATPITYQLTPAQVTTLLGQNNIFADSGEILDGEYIADASTVIAALDARITALENA